MAIGELLKGSSEISLVYRTSLDMEELRRFFSRSLSARRGSEFYFTQESSGSFWVVPYIYIDDMI